MAVKPDKMEETLTCVICQDLLHDCVRCALRPAGGGGGLWVESADAAVVLLLECVSSRKCGSVTEALEADVAMAWVGTVLSDLGVLARCLVRLTRREGPCSGTEAPRLLGCGKRQPVGGRLPAALRARRLWFSCTSWNTELPHVLSFLSARTE